MIQIKKYKNSDQKNWDNFVDSSNNGTIFQSRQFINYHLNRVFVDHSLLFIMNSQILAVFIAAKITKNNNKVLYSHPGSSYGGLVIDNNLKYDDFENIISKLDKYCIDKGFNSIFFVQTPYIYYNKCDFALEYCLKWHGFQEKEVYISHSTLLNTKQKVLSSLNKRKQRYIKQIELSKTFQIIQSSDFNLFYPLLAESKKNYNINPTHSLDELQSLYSSLPEKIILFLSYQNKEVIGGSLVIIANKNVGLIFYNVILDKFKKTQLASYQFYHCMKFCKKINLQYIDFGVSHIPQDKNPLTPKLSLMRFKEQFGATGVMRYVYAKDYSIEK